MGTMITRNSGSAGEYQLRSAVSASGVFDLVANSFEFLLRGGGGGAPALAQLQGTQTRNIENLHCFGVDAPDEAIAFKFGNCPHRGFARDAEIIREIKPIDGQAQPPIALVEKFRMTQEIEQ